MTPASRGYVVGPFRLDPDAGVLTYEGRAVALGSRAVAVLSTLVEHANEYIPKARIIGAAWPDVVVEENNLSVQISAIRRVLALAPGGERWVETLSRRGYRFVGPVAPLPAASAPSTAFSTAAATRRANLPEPLTSFVGRERELVELKRLLPPARLLTIVGAGGIGKTRLAIQVAAEVADAYHDGAWFVDLAPITSPALVPNAVAQALGVGEAPAVPLVERLRDHLSTRQLLLVLDNCEHVVQHCTGFVETILGATRDVSVIATSREPLRAAGEQTYVLRPLSLPDASLGDDAMRRSEAVQLFIERAQKQRPGFAVTPELLPGISALCVQLDGIPLALELAAARMRLLNVDQINARLGDRFQLLTGGTRTAAPRHQTLRALMDWSFDLLSQEEKDLLCRLSVFSGTCSLEAIEQVCSGEGIRLGSVLDVVTALVDKSLLVPSEGDGTIRYGLLETVREYARGRLQERGGQSRWNQRHASHFLDFAEAAEQQLTRADQRAWLDRLETEHDNLRAAMKAASATGNGGVALRLAGALWRFWYMRGHLTEGRGWLCTLLQAARDAPPADRAKALHGASAIAWQQGDFASARKWGEESLALRRALGDQAGIAMSLNALGLVAYQQCEYNSARALHEESLAIRRTLGDRNGIAMSLHNLGMVACDQGDYALARALHVESLAAYRATDNRHGMAQSLTNQGDVARNQGDPAAAKALYEESLAIHRELGDRWGISIALNNLGNVAREQGDYAAARTLLDSALALRRELGDRQGIAQSLYGLANLAREQADMAAAQRLFRESLSITRELGDRWGMALALEGLAQVAFHTAAPDRGACIWGGAERLRDAIGAPLSPAGRAGADEQIAAARTTMGDEAFARAREHGRALTVEQLVQYAMGLSMP